MRNQIHLTTRLCLIACVCLLAACSLQPVSSADQIATQVARDLAVAATLTAVAGGDATPVAPADATATPAPAEATPTEPRPAADTPPPQPTDEPAQPTEAPAPQPTDIPVPPTAPPEPTTPPIAYSDVNFSGNPAPGDEVGGNIQIAGAEPNENGVPVVRAFLAIRVFARFPSSAAQDGAGVDNVLIRINDDQTGELVQERAERTAGYCVFGGGEPDCELWVFADHNNQWPNGQPVSDGSYTVNVSITKAGDSEASVFWNFQFEVAQSS